MQIGRALLVFKRSIAVCVGCHTCAWVLECLSVMTWLLHRLPDIERQAVAESAGVHIVWHACSAECLQSAAGMHTECDVH